jgi:acyl-CoA dehydrogenase
MKVTTQGEEVMNLLWDVIAARGFEKDMYFDGATHDVRTLPKLEGTVHVNMALVVKFMANYFFQPADLPVIPSRKDTADDTFLFDQGPTKGLGQVRFHDWRPVYDAFDLANVKLLKEQIGVLVEFLMKAAPSKEQAKDIDFLLSLGELFTVVVYGQLILEEAKLEGTDNDLVDQIFDVLIRDFSRYALDLYSKTGATDAQRELCLKMIRNPERNDARFEKIWAEKVIVLADAYEQNP